MYLSGTLDFIGSIFSENFSITNRNIPSNSHVDPIILKCERHHSCQSKKVKEDKKESFGSLFARNFIIV